jgi:drug/metabolite transporter (DMT)-like permease
MIIWLVLLAAASFAYSSILEKEILRERKVNSKHFIIAVFAISSVIMLPLLYFFGNIGPEAYKPVNIFLIFILIFFAIMANILIFFAVKWEKINKLEPMKLLEPIFVILLAFIFFESERNPIVIVPAIIASLALLISHIRKHHLVFNKYSIAAILGSLCYALEAMVAKILLEFYSPLSLYFTRAIFVFLFALIIFRSNPLKELGKKERIITVFIGSMWVLYRVIVYFGYQSWGLVFTTLTLFIAHIMVYIFAALVLKEKILKRNIFAAIVILACVAYINLTA